MAARARTFLTWQLSPPLLAAGAPPPVDKDSGSHTHGPKGKELWCLLKGLKHVLQNVPIEMLSMPCICLVKYSSFLSIYKSLTLC